jgi:hypothetical protein
MLDVEHVYVALALSACVDRIITGGGSLAIRIHLKPALNGVSWRWPKALPS